MLLKDKIGAQLPEFRERIIKLVRESGTVKISEVNVSQLFGGMREVHVVVSDISHIDPYEGIRLRGYTIPEVLKELPKCEGTDFPLAGGLYYLLMVGCLPSLDEALQVEDEWKERGQLPDYVIKSLQSMPPETHPMTMLSAAILMLQNESIFVRRYDAGMQKSDYWEAALEDSMNLTAKLPAIAAYIYNLKYNSGKLIPPNPDLDWSANFAHMIQKGDDREYQDLSRLFFVLHSDHEGANVSAHTTHLVASTLSSVYYACSAGMNALAGPLHGLANQECLRWLLQVRSCFDSFPTHEQLEAFAWETLRSDKVIPGYGHAVLRTIDPRFTAQLEFGKKYMPDDELFRLVNLVFQVVPQVLKQYGKVKNPWPNVDAINGTMQYHYGVRQFDFYTVLFGLSRILGLTAHSVWSRAMGLPIERPQSITTPMIEEYVETNHIVM